MILKSDHSLCKYSVQSNRLLSMLRIVLSRVSLSLMKRGQWSKKWVEDSICWPQLYEGFIVSWKLCLNLCSVEWFRPSLGLVMNLLP